MVPVLLGFGVVAAVVLGARYLSSHSSTPAPHDPPPEAVDHIPGGDAGVDGG